MSKRGALILIEGLDRAGKSSQCEILRNKIASIYGENSVQILKFPDRTTEIGQLLDRVLTNKLENPMSPQAVHLLFSANRWEIIPKMLQLLGSGVTVIMDRYVYSGLAFSAAKGVPGMSLHWCRQPDVGLPCPDVTIFLDISEDVAQARSGYGDEIYENSQFQHNVRLCFQELGASATKPDSWVTISADRDIEQISADIFKTVKPLLDQPPSGPLRVFT